MQAARGLSDEALAVAILGLSEDDRRRLVALILSGPRIPATAKQTGGPDPGL
jgi:hypothetical protein